MDAKRSTVCVNVLTSVYTSVNHVTRYRAPACSLQALQQLFAREEGTVVRLGRDAETTCMQVHEVLASPTRHVVVNMAILRCNQGK
jgi:hypothetical protein